MEQFTDLFNQLQEVISVVGHSIAFPQIVVVGSQSDGKSSVLESIVKNGFLPRGTGVVTRTPIILQLRNTRSDGQNQQEYASVGYPDPDNPSYQVVETIDDFALVGKKITDATERLAGNNKNIVDKPITVTLNSPNVPDLTLVDLPGLVEMRSGDQPSDIKEQVEQLIRNYVQNPNAIILAVHPATTDLANSKSLKMAREMDPNGQRTICVITKLDVNSDHSEDKTTLLNGQDIANHHSKVLKTIGVINKSSADQSKPGWSSDDQLNKEERWFKTHYPRLADQHGTRVLSHYLAMLFREHVRKCLPALKAAVDEMVSDNHAHLSSLGEDIHEKLTNPEARGPGEADPGHVLVVDVITKFVDYFKGALTGDIDQGNTEVKGGARIEELFNETYWNALTAIIPLDDVSEQQIWTQIRNSWGTERQMFLNIKAFRVLVKHEMARMEHESIRCVKLAHQEMLSVRNSAGEHIGNTKEQFPKLYERIVDIVAQFMETKLEETKTMVSHCVQMQLDYLNVKHPDFLKAQVDAMKRFNEIAAQIEDSMNSDGSTNLNPGAPVRHAPIPPTTPKPARPQYNPGQAPPNNGVADQQVNSSNQNTSVPMHMANKSRGMTKREKLECEITVQLVREYFDFIRRIVRDSVPKVVVRFLVNAIRDEVLQELLTKIATGPQVFAPLLTESEIMATKRKTYNEKLTVFRNAAQLIRTLETV